MIKSLNKQNGALEINLLFALYMSLNILSEVDLGVVKQNVFLYFILFFSKQHKATKPILTRHKY